MATSNIQQGITETTDNNPVKAPKKKAAKKKAAAKNKKAVKKKNNRKAKKNTKPVVAKTAPVVEQTAAPAAGETTAPVVEQTAAAVVGLAPVVEENIVIIETSPAPTSVAEKDTIVSSVSQPEATTPVATNDYHNFSENRKRLKNEENGYYGT